ncbi:hypothetical protein E2C01_082250 [Portunus trituberculatus]|uniref:Uncharacterized protein n=1 Tax=Portunus trituberculatus TaxID=210409 RepID=A0A5B7IYK3_PORTR|nr:hypothetical protein [Portunus trituberculatus]
MEDELTMFYRAMKSRIYNPKGDTLSINETDYGARFNQEVSTYLKNKLSKQTSYRRFETAATPSSKVLFNNWKQDSHPQETPSEACVT